MSKSKSPLNNKLFNKIAAAIEAHPEQFSMKFWHTVRPGFKSIDVRYLRRVQIGEIQLPADRDTAHCVGGWADFLTAGRDSLSHPGGTFDRAATALGITDAPAAFRLFYGYWPKRYCGRTPDGRLDGIWASPAQAAAYLHKIAEVGSLPPER